MKSFDLSSEIGIFDISQYLYSDARYASIDTRKDLMTAHIGHKAKSWQALGSESFQTRENTFSALLLPHQSHILTPMSKDAESLSLDFSLMTFPNGRLCRK